MSNSIAAPDQDLDATEESRRAVEEVIMRLESARARSGGRPLSFAEIRSELVDREYRRSDGTRDQLVNRALLSLVEATGVPVAPLAPGYMLFEHPKTRKFEAVAVEQFIREAGPGGKLEGVFGERQRALVETLVEWSGIAADNDPDLPRRLAEFGRDVSAIVAEAAPHATAQVVSRLFGQTDSSVLDSASLGGARERVGALTLENYNMFLISADPSQGSHVKAAYGEIYGLLAPLLRDGEKEALQQAVGKFEAALVEYETKEVADEIARREKEYAAAEARSPGSVEARAIKDRIEALRTIASGPANGAVAKLNPNARIAEVFARWATLTRGMDADSRRRLDTALGAGPVKGAWREAVDAARDTMRRTREEIAALGEDPDTLQSKLKSASAAAWNGFGRMLSVATGIGAAARERRATREAALLPIKTFERIVGGEIAQRRQEFDVGAVLPAIQAQRIARLANMPSLAVALNDAVKNDKEVSALSIYQRLRYVHSDAQIRQIIQKAGFHVINDREGRTTLLRDAREAEASMIRVATRVTPELAGETDGVVSDDPAATAVGAKRNLREAPNLAEQATRLPVDEWIRRAAESRMLMERVEEVKGPGGIARKTKTWVLPAVPALGLPEKAVDAADPRWKDGAGKPDPYAFLRSVHAGLVKLAVDSNRYVSGAVIEEYRDQPWAAAWTPQILDQARAPAARKRTPTVEKVIATVGRASGPEFAGAADAMPARAAAAPAFSAGAELRDDEILRRAVSGVPQDAQAALDAIEARTQRRAEIQFSAGAAPVNAAYAANLTGHGREARGFHQAVEPLLYIDNLRPAPAADVAARLSAVIEAVPPAQRTLPGADLARAGWSIQGLAGREGAEAGDSSPGFVYALAAANGRLALPIDAFAPQSAELDAKLDRSRSGLLDALAAAVAEFYPSANEVSARADLADWARTAEPVTRFIDRAVASNAKRMSFSERIAAVADGMLPLAEGLAPSTPAVEFVTVKNGKRLFDETIAFSAGAQVLLGDGSGGSIYGRPGAAIARRTDGTVVAAKDVIDLMAGRDQRKLVSDGTIDAGAARGMALNAIDIRGEFLPFERLDANQAVVARGLVNTEGFRGVWEIQQLQAGGHRLRLVERGGRLIEAGLFPTEIAAATAAFQVDVRARARDAGNPDWMRAANLYQLVQTDNGVIARVAFGADLNGRTGVVAERADADLAAAQVIAQESAVAATLKASVAPELDVKAHLADFQRTVDTALGRAQPVSNAPRNAASKVVDFVARHPILAGASAAAAGAAAIATRLALSAGHPPPAPRAWIETDGDAMAISRVGQALSKIEGIKVRSISHAEPARIEIEYDRADPATGLAAAVRIKDVAALRFADATLPDFVDDGDRNGARERFAADIAAAFDHRHALRWSGDGFTAEHPSSSYQLVAAPRPGAAALEDLYEPVAAANQRSAAFGKGMSLTDGVPVPFDFAQQAVRQHASGVLQWSAGQDGGRVAPLGFAGSYELRPAAEGVEALYARRSGAPEQRPGEPIAFSLGFHPDADAAALAAQQHNDAARESARAERDKRPIGVRRDGPQATAGEASYVLVPVENRAAQFDVYRIEHGSAPVYITRARDEADARERLAAVGRNPDALRLLTPEETQAWRIQARDRVNDEIRTTSRRVAASAGLDLLVRVASDLTELDARVRNIEASRSASKTSFLDVPDADRLRAVAAGAKIDPASGALFVPADASPELRETLTSFWDEHEEVARNRAWLDVPAAEHDVAMALGAAYDGVAKRFYIPEGIEPALEAGLRDVFQTERAQKAVDAERAAQDAHLTAAFSAGAEGLSEAGIAPAIDTRAFARDVQMKTGARTGGPALVPTAPPQAKQKAKDGEKADRPMPSLGDKHQPTGRSIADEIVAVAASAITAVKGAATNGADIYRRVNDHEANKRAEMAKSANTGPGAHFDQDVVSSSTPAGLASPARDASADPVRASAGAKTVEKRPAASVDLVIAARTGLPPVDAKRDLSERVKALGDDHLLIAYELTRTAHGDSQDSLRRHASATGAAKVGAFTGGLAAIHAEASARGLSLPAAQAPAAQTAARPRSRSEDNGR